MKDMLAISMALHHRKRLRLSLVYAQKLEYIGLEVKLTEASLHLRSHVR